MDLLFFNPNSLTRLGALADAATGGHRVALLAIIVALVLHIIGHAVIGWQLWQMQKFWWQREREVDAMAARLRETNREVEEALDRQHEAMTQALDRQRQALDRQRAVLGPLLRPTP